MEKIKTDKKGSLLLIAFIIVGIALFTTVFMHSKKSMNEASSKYPSAEKNVPTQENNYYGIEAVNAAGDVFDKNGNKLDISTLKNKTDFYDKNGKMINLPTISPEEYAKIKEGMSYADVCGIIGGEGEIIREVDKPGDEFYTVCYFFYGDRASSSASFIFQGDRLKSKANTAIEEKKK